MHANDLPHGIRILLAVISAILSVFLLFFTCVAIFMADVRILTEKNNIQKLIHGALFTEPALSVPADSRFRPYLAVGNPILDTAPDLVDAIGMLDAHALKSSLTENLKNQLLDRVYDVLEEQFTQSSGGEIPVSREEVVKFVNESTLSSYLSDKMACLVSDMLTGEKTAQFPREEIVRLLEQNAGLIEKQFGFTLTPEAAESFSFAVAEHELVQALNQKGLTIITGEVSPGLTAAAQEAGKLPFAGGIFRDIFQKGGPGPLKTIFYNIRNNIQSPSDVMLALGSVASSGILSHALGQCGILIILMLLVNYAQLYKGLRKIGRTLIIAALPFVIPSLIPLLLKSTDTIGAQIVKLTVWVHCGVLLLGVFIFILSFFTKGSRQKKLKKNCIPMFSADNPAQRPLPGKKDMPGMKKPQSPPFCQQPYPQQPYPQQPYPQQPYPQQPYPQQPYPQQPYPQQPYPQQPASDMPVFDLPEDIHIPSYDPEESGRTFDEN